VRADITEVALIILRKDRFLLCQRRSDAARWANMWEFPTKALATSKALPRQTKALAPQLVGFRIRPIRRFAKMRYGITRFRVTLVGMEAKFLGGRSHRNTYQTLKWISAADLIQFPLSVPQRRLARKWLENDKVDQQ
jgi:adenine-specific DNA glycosylase